MRRVKGMGGGSWVYLYSIFAFGNFSSKCWYFCCEYLGKMIDSIFGGRAVSNNRRGTKREKERKKEEKKKKVSFCLSTFFSIYIF